MYGRVGFRSHSADSIIKHMRWELGRGLVIRMWALFGCIEIRSSRYTVLSRLRISRKRSAVRNRPGVQRSGAFSSGIKGNQERTTDKTINCTCVKHTRVSLKSLYTGMFITLNKDVALSKHVLIKTTGVSLTGVCVCVCVRACVCVCVRACV